MVSFTNRSEWPKFVIHGNYLAFVVDAIDSSESARTASTCQEGRRAFPKEPQLLGKTHVGKQGAGGGWGMGEDIIPNIRPKGLGRRRTWHFSLSQLNEELVCLFSLLK